MELSDKDKGLLTEFLGECWHEWERTADNHVSHHVCVKCGLSLSVRKEFLPKLRSFTTWQDLGDLRNKLVEKGMWWKFHAVMRHEFCKDFIAVCSRDEMEAEYNNWLLSPSIFIPLVVEFLRKEQIC